MERLGIEFLSVFDMPPVQYVELAADLGCRYVSSGLGQVGYNPHDYPKASLRDDPALRREMVAAMRDRGVSISLGEGFGVRPGVETRGQAADLDLMGELGVTRINAISLDPDLPRTFDELGVLAEMAAARGMETTMEFAPGLAVADLPTALEAVRHVGRPDFRLLIDTMHLLRSGSTPARLAAVPPALIGYVQLSDATHAPRFDTYMEEAMYERMVPGEGELPLREVLAILPREVVIGLEIPQRSLAEAGVDPHERLGRCVAAARAMLAELPAATA
jgi:sugar phosphate isomerase/epimerase